MRVSINPCLVFKANSTDSIQETTIEEIKNNSTVSDNTFIILTSGFSHKKLSFSTLKRNVSI